jgi:amicoumacin kinase
MIRGLTGGSLKIVPNSVLNEFAGRYGVRAEDLLKFGGGEDWSDGTVYRFDARGQAMLLKIMDQADHAPHGEESLDERLRYLDYLGANDAPIIHPVHSARDCLVERIRLDGMLYQAYAWRMIEGRHIDNPNPLELGGFYRDWGAAIGRIHALAQNYPDWRESPVRDENGESIISWCTEMKFFHGWLKDDDIRNAWDALRDELTTLPIRRDNFGFIHNDPHAHNLLIMRNGVALLDFDVANYHWFMVDLAIPVYSEIYRIWNHKPVSLEIKRLIVDGLLEGYSRENTLLSEEFDRLELFLHYRRILLFCVFYDQIRRHDPAYLESMKRDILERRPLLVDNSV